MASGGLGDLVVKLSADIAQFQSATDKAVHIAQKNSQDIQAAFNKAKVALAGIGVGISGAAIVSFVKDLVDQAAKLDDFAEKTGASVENLSRLQQVAKLTSTSFESVEGAVIKFAKALNTTDTGNVDAANALKALGLDFETIKGLDPALALEAIAKKMDGFKDSTSKTAVAMALFGKSGAELIPFLKDLVRYGEISSKVTTEQAAAAETLQHQMKKFALESENTKQAILLDIIKPMTDWLEAIREAKKELGLLGAAWVALGGLGRGGAALLFGTDKENIKKSIAEIDEQIAIAQKQLSAGSLKPQGADNHLFSFLIPDIKLTEDAIQKLNVNILAMRLKRAELLQLISPVKPNQDIKPNLDFVLRDKFDQGAREKLIDEADLATKLQRTYLEGALSLDKEINKQRLAALEAYQADSAISIKQYYDLRREISQSGLSQELADLDKQIALETKRLNDLQAKAGVGFTKTTAGKTENDTGAANENTRAQVDANERLLKLASERQKLQVTVSGELSTLSFNERRAVDDLTSSYELLRAKLLEIKGETVASALIQFDEQQRRLRASFAVNNKPEGVAAIDQLRERTEQQERFNKAKSDFDNINARLAIDEERIQNSLRVNAISDLTALNRLGDARKKAAADLEKQLELLQQISASGDNPKLVLQLEQMRVATQKLRTETELLADKFNTLFSDAFASAFSDFVSGTKTAADAFKSFTNSIIKSLNDIAAKEIASQIFGAKGGNAGGGVGGLIAGLFNGNSSKAQSNPDYNQNDSSASWLSAVGSIFSKFVGSYDVGTPYVRETGFAMVHKGEAIIPAGENTGRVSVSNVFNITGPVDARSQAQIAAAAGMSVQRALARNT